MQTPQLDTRSWAILIALAFIWSGSFVLTEIALREVPPLSLALLRVTLGAAAMWGFALWRGRAVPRSARVWGGWVVMGLLNNALPFSLIMWGQTQIEGGLASIFNAMTAVFGAVVAGALLPDERLTLRKIVGAGLGLWGVAHIIGQEALTNFDLRHLGQLAILGATLSYSFASVWGKTRLGGQAPELNAAGMLTCAALLLTPTVFALEGGPHIPHSAGPILAVVALALGATSIAYLMYFALLRRAGAANTMLVTLLIPPFAIGLGAALLNESLPPEAMTGFGLIALGLIVIDGRTIRALVRRAGGA